MGTMICSPSHYIFSIFGEWGSRMCKSGSCGAKSCVVRPGSAIKNYTISGRSRSSSIFPLKVARTCLCYSLCRLWKLVLTLYCRRAYLHLFYAGERRFTTNLAFFVAHLPGRAESSRTSKIFTARNGAQQKWNEMCDFHTQMCTMALLHHLWECPSIW